MIFKTLILLGFFTVQRVAFIHSDIHRRVMQVEEYAVQKVCARTVLSRNEWSFLVRKTHAQWRKAPKN